VGSQVWSRPRFVAKLRELCYGSLRSANRHSSYHAFATNTILSLAEAKHMFIGPESTRNSCQARQCRRHITIVRAMYWEDRDSSPRATRSRWPTSALGPSNKGNRRYSCQSRRPGRRHVRRRERRSQLPRSGAGTRSATESGGCSKKPTWREGSNHVPRRPLMSGRRSSRPTTRNSGVRRRFKRLQHLRRLPRVARERKRTVTAVKVDDSGSHARPHRHRSPEKGDERDCPQPLANRLLEARL